jgi:hypothetical protein
VAAGNLLALGEPICLESPPSFSSRLQHGALQVPLNALGVASFVYVARRSGVLRKPLRCRRPKFVFPPSKA